MDSRTAITEIECPVCMEIMEAPIYQCRTGHTVCHHCIRKLSNCPTCEVPLEKNIRNFFLEELAEKISYACKFENFGCKKLFSNIEIEAHEKNCEFINFKCGVYGCAFGSSRKELVKHMNVVHEKLVKKDFLEIAVPITCLWEYFNNLSYISDGNETLLRVCVSGGKLHVHSFNYLKKDGFKLLFYYNQNRLRPSILVRNLCLGFNEECGERYSLDLSYLQKIMPSTVDIYIYAKVSIDDD